MHKNYLITGGTGSFGQEIVKTLLNFKDIKRIVIFSRDEDKQFHMQNKFKNNKRLRFFLGDVRDLRRCLFALKNIEVVVHTAALKQVPAAEYNPTECIQTNILGAENVIEASIRSKVKKVIALSTDKASSPANLYGTTKLVSDKLFVSANNFTGSQNIKFSVARYGNVIGSRGSVIPFFKEIIKNGKKDLPITHKEMTRFFITLKQGVNFVLKCLSIMKGGEIFIPKLPSAKIIDLAKALKSDAKLKFTGIRPGEKIHEELFSLSDSMNTIEFKNFFIIKPIYNFKNKIYYEKSSKRETGKKIKKFMEYNSFNNLNRLNVNDIKKLINE